MQKLLALLFSLLLLAGPVGCLAGCGEQTTLDPNTPSRCPSGMSAENRQTHR